MNVCVCVCVWSSYTCGREPDLIELYQHPYGVQSNASFLTVDREYFVLKIFRAQKIRRI